MNVFFFQISITIGILTSTMGIAAPSTRSVPESPTGCYHFIFVQGDIAISVKSNLSTPTITLSGLSNQSVSAMPTQPVLTTEMRDGRCVAVAYKPVALPYQNSDTKVTLEIPDSVKQFQIVNLKGRVEGRGSLPRAQVSLNLDRGSVTWEQGTFESFSVHQTSGETILKNITAQLDLLGENSQVSLIGVRTLSKNNRIRVKHGAVTLNTVEGLLNVATVTASVMTENTKDPVKIETRSGTISTRESTAPMDLASETGTIRSSWASKVAGTSRMTTTRGTITLLVSPALDAKIEAESVSLPVESEFQGKPFGSKTVIPLGAESHRIVARSSLGSIVIKKF